MYVNLPKKFIEENLLIHLEKSSLGRPLKVELWRIMQAIIYRLKSGSQWRELPMKQFCNKVIISWNTVYYHFKKWSSQRKMQQLWQKVLKTYRRSFNLSSIQLDGSHTPAKRGGSAVAYQGRKKAKTTNALFLTDSAGLPLAMSVPVKGKHNDLFEIESKFRTMLADIRLANIPTKGLFMNADAGFDSKKFRQVCESEQIIANIDFNRRNSQIPDTEFFLDALLYKDRFVVERTNAWLDAFKALLIRFETKTCTWQALHFLAFALIVCRKQTNHF